jgi:predicted nucleic acid-binding protein
LVLRAKVRFPRLQYVWLDGSYKGEEEPIEEAVRRYLGDGGVAPLLGQKIVELVREHALRAYDAVHLATALEQGNLKLAGIGFAK